MFSDKSKFRNYRPCHNVSIRVAEGSSTKVLGTGDIGPLTNVLHVEGLVFDLVSEPALARATMSGSWSGLSRVAKYAMCLGLINNSYKSIVYTFICNKDGVSSGPQTSVYQCCPNNVSRRQSASFRLSD